MFNPQARKANAHFQSWTQLGVAAAQKERCIKSKYRTGVANYTFYAFLSALGVLYSEHQTEVSEMGKPQVTISFNAKSWSSMATG